MNATSIVEMIREHQPFTPLIFEFTNGQREVVRHLDNIMVFGSYLLIAQFSNGDAIPEKAKRYSLLYLVSVEPAETPSP